MSFLKGLSGKNVEEKVVEYSEIYGEILLGMHRDLETMQRRVSEYRDNSLQMEKIFDRKIQEVKAFERELAEIKSISTEQNKNIKALLSVNEENISKYENRANLTSNKLELLETICAKQNKQIKLLSWIASFVFLITIGGFVWIMLSFIK